MTEPTAALAAAAAERRRRERWDRSALEAHQLARLNELLAEILPRNAFYAAKFRNAPKRLGSLAELSSLPLTTKEELVEAGVEARSTYPAASYVRYHQTSGTHGRPMPVLDTPSDWQWWLDGWQFVLDAAEVTAEDRAMLAFSFGPFIGFWTAHDALIQRGSLVIPGGGLSSVARLDLLDRESATVLCCTPSYALHLGEVAAEHKINLANSAVSRIIVAGEPGGSSPPVRSRIEQTWNARIVDHAGATEVGPWGYADAGQRGLHILESEFIAEFLSVETGEPAEEGELAQLVLTALGRRGMPAVRYRTGDLVRPVWSQDEMAGVESAMAGRGSRRAMVHGTQVPGPAQQELRPPAGGEDADPRRPKNNFVLLDGGVLGRADDMLIIRGVNVFPSAVEAVLRSFPEVAEYRLTARKRGAMDELAVEVEDHLGDARRIAEELQIRIGLAIDVRLAAPLSLPRFEGKGRRFIDERKRS